MTQSRRMSAAESVANVAIGFSVSWLANLIVLPRYGCAVTGDTAFTIGLWFTAISLARSYMLRRAFEAAQPLGNR